MGRELRRVPADWVHPKSESSPERDAPIHDRSYTDAAEEWREEFLAWEPDPEYSSCRYYWEWAGNPPREEDYRPDWPEETRTHFQMYETCSEGTPISPVLSSPEAVARWCADNGASMFGGQTGDYDAWMRICNDDASGLLVIGPKGMAPDAMYFG